jgi:hypothetical protein
MLSPPMNATSGVGAPQALSAESAPALEPPRDPVLFE